MQATPKENQSNFLYYGLLLYTFLFYSQIAGRFPILSSFRIELLFGTLLLLFCFLKIISGEINFNENRLNIAALIFLLVAFFTIPFALIKNTALDWFIRLLKFFAIYLMIVSAINTEKRLKVFMYVYLVMILLLFVEPFIFSLQGKGFIYNNHMWRLAGVTGYFAHPNQLGGITAANLPFFYFLLKCEKSVIKRILLILLIIIALRVIMLTQSRTAFLGVLTFGFLLWIYSDKKIPTLLLVTLFFIVTWQFSPQQTRDRFLTLRSTWNVMTEDTSQLTLQERTQRGSMADRWELIKRGLICFSENPLLGVGLHCFHSYNWRKWGHWFPPHNTYVQALAEMGIIGFSAFFLVIIFTFKNLKESKKILFEGKKENSFLFHMSSAVTIYLFARLVVSFFGQDLYGNYWWIAGGLSLVILRISKMKQEEYKENGLITHSK